MKQYQTIVVGGGPAGATAAYLQGQLGYRVLLLEQAQFPRSKPCAGLLTGKTLKTLDSIYHKSEQQLIVEELIIDSSNFYQIYNQNQLIYEGQTVRNFYYTSREIFDSYLIKKARSSGVEVRENSRVVELDLKKQMVVTEEGEVFNYRYLIGADGANSRVRQTFFKESPGLKSRFKKGMGITLEARIPRDNNYLSVDHPMLHYGVINWGYGWVFPEADRLVLGIAGLREKNENPLQLFEDYLELLNLNPDMIDYRGWTLPYGNFLTRPGCRNLLLVGDAAGLVNPITGEGIYYALKSGQLAVRAIDKVEGHRTTGLIDIYADSLKEEIIPELKFFLRLRALLCKSPGVIQGWLLKAALHLFGNYLTDKIQTGHRSEDL
ncbi:MAG: NAD(P)/FAD-dependent oxidoreductase [Bacillota bacterium]